MDNKHLYSMITSHWAYCSQSVGRPHILTSTPIHSRCSYEPICNRTKRKYAKWQSNIFVRQWTIYNIVITLLLIATIIYNISEWDITEIQWFYLKQQISIITNKLKQNYRVYLQSQDGIDDREGIYMNFCCSWKKVCVLWQEIMTEGNL